MIGKGKIAVGLGVLLTAVFAAFPAGASALAHHPFLGSFCEPTGLGTAPCEPSFIRPEGMAIDQATHDLLVIDRESGTVSRYHQNGTPADFSALGTNMIDGEGSGPPCTPPSIECDGTPEGHLAFGGPGEVQVAVDNSGGETGGDIYVTQAAARVVDIFDSDGSYLGQLTESSEGSFATLETEPCGIAVDPSGNVYLGDFSGAIHKYEPSVNPPVNADNNGHNFPFSSNCTLAAGAGASAGSLFAVRFEGAVVKLDSTTGAEKYTVRSDNDTTVAVNPESGHLDVAAGSSVFEYKASDESEATLLSEVTPGGEKAAGIAVDGASADLYVAHNVTANLEVWGPAVVLPEAITEEASPVGAESATLRGAVNPEGLPLTECHFEWGETQAYGHLAPCEEPDAAEVGEGTSPVPVHAEISDLEAGTAYHFRLAAVNANGSEAGEDETLSTLGASIEDEAASLVTATSARLSAKVNPNGEETAYVFEYVSEAQFEASEEGGFAQATSLPSAPGEAGSGSEFLEVGVQLLGLEPGTTYHFRLTATTPATTHFGQDKTFATHAFSTIGLPDERAYELVSPPQKIGEVFPPEPLAIWTGSCKDCLPGINDEPMPMQASDDGERVAYEGSPFTGGLAAGPNEYLSQRGAGGWATQGLSTPLFGRGEDQGYKVFSADLSRGVLSQIEPALSPDAPAGGEGQSFANLYLRGEDGALTPLVTEEPPQRDPGEFKVGFTGANAGTVLVGALHYVIFEANDALTDGVPEAAPAAPAITAEERNLYEWVDGELRLVNVAPGNASAISGTVFGSGRELSEEQEGSGADVDGAISADGSHIFFSEKASGQVYVRIDGKETREVDDAGKFLVATADGSKVLLSDGCLYDVDAEECLADLTQGEGGLEGILGATEDLSRVYFVDTAVLSGENAEHKSPVEGEPNLYAWDEGSISFIATLDEGDNRFSIVQPQVGDWMPSSSSRTAQVSPDGRFLAFMSRAPLTGYDNHVRSGDECRPNAPAACFEVFEYRADTEELACVSCNPSGERPLGTANLSLIYRGKRSVAGFPQPTNLTSNEGRIFFESQDALTLGDLNGNVKDVYEWEPNGMGSCERPQGCVSLISSGKSPDDSILLDATPSGNDAFFITREGLLSQDGDEKLDLYDARVGGGIKEAPTPPCGGEPCRGPGTSSPSLGGSASDSFRGPGNAHPKHKKHHKKKHHKKHHKKKHHKKHKRHNEQGGHR